MKRKIYLALSLTASVSAILTSFLISYSNSQFLDQSFLSNLPITIGILVLILIGLNIVAYFLTQKIIEPINKLEDKIKNNKEINNIEYMELVPFIQTIESQRYEISKKIYELEKSNQLKDQLTSNISHELKTPLTSINGFAELIAQGNLSQEDCIKFSNIILKEANRLLDIINSSLSISFLQKEKIVFDIFNIKEIIDEIYLPLNIIAEKNHILLDLSCDNIIFNGNRRMIKDLLYNLIDNSIKYNHPNGYVKLNIRKKNNFLNITVEDNGIGIEAIHLDKIFNRFYTVDNSRDKKYSGSGLGLSICKHIVKIHSGKINISSQPNLGTKVMITLPITNASNL